MRSKNGIWPQIEATFKQMDMAATEFECFQGLKKQEQLAAKHRINNLWSEVQKQKELERTLQKKYGDLMVELERTQNIMEQFRVEAQQKEEIEAKNHAIEEVEAQQQEETEAKNHVLEISEATADEINVQGTENCEAVPISADPEIATVQDQATSSSKVDMDVDSSSEAQATHITGVTLPDAPAAEDENSKAVEGENIESVIENSETAVDTSAALEIKSNEENGEGQDVANPDEVMEAANKPDNIKEATLLDDMQVDDGKRDDEAN
ncbi:cell division cycle 5-like protein [Trifolium pratense]|nr:cell division cycle 5-like protein [Trifolium pratense]